MTPAEHATAIEDAAFAYGAACHVHGQEALAGALKNAIEAKKLLSAAIRAGVDAAHAPTDVVAELEEVKTVCAQAYQVMGVLLSDAGRLDSPEAGKILDNLVEQRLRHTDVLPWAAQAAPQGWQLVPVEPTEEMKLAMASAGVKHLEWVNDVYTAMLSAAPKP